jgi:hypothetical protein
MTYRNLQQGIQAIRDGNKQEGARLIRIALKNDELQAGHRAIGWIWLAETTNNPQEKGRYYNQALAVDPGNEHAQKRLAALLAQGLPQERPAPAQPEQPAQAPPGGPPPAQTASPSNPPAEMPPRKPPTQPQVSRPITSAGGRLHRAIGIYGGPNGAGTGFFISRNGLIATSRFVVGGSRTVDYEINRGDRAAGQVVRSWASYDLAFIHTGLTIKQLLPASNAPTIPGGTAISAITYSGQVVNGERRATKQNQKPEWFPTDIDRLADAGGNPVFNPQNLLVGMLTTNANRSSPYIFGLHIGVIYRLLEQYTQEMQSQDELTYCAGCGNLSRAAAHGGFYCEYCGRVLPQAEGRERFPVPQMAGLYGETMHQPCPECGSTVGFYQGACLRCGYQVPRGR